MRSTGLFMSASNEVVASRLECAVSLPCLDEINQIVQIQLVLDDSCRELCIAEDTYEGVSKVL
jgi:hypothetical protein